MLIAWTYCQYFICNCYNYINIYNCYFSFSYHSKILKKEVEIIL